MIIKLNENQLVKLLLESENPIDSKLVTFFKVLNTEKKKYKRKPELLQRIEKLLPFINIPEEYSKYILELYLLNYRPDGDYSSITIDNFVDPRKQRGKTTPNTKAYQYTVAQLPFRGSSLEGFWRTDSKGVDYYVVMSYEWYPVYIFKDGKWYENIERYSSSTSRQMYNASPYYSTELQSPIYLLTKDEMKMLMGSYNHEQVMKHKLERIKSKESEYQNARMSILKLHGSYWRENHGWIPVAVKYKINSVDLNENKATITIDIYDVVKVERGRSVATPENYLKGDLGQVNKEYIENRVAREMEKKLREYIGGRTINKDWEKKELDKYNILDFKFNHLKK